MSIQVELASDDTITLTVREEHRHQQTKQRIWVSYTDLTSTVKEGSTILLDDGAIELRVTAVGEEEVRCRVVNSGMLGNKKGVK